MIPYIRAPFRPFRLRLHKREGVARLPPLAFVYASGRRIGQVLLRLVVLTLGLGRLFTFGLGRLLGLGVRFGFSGCVGVLVAVGRSGVSVLARGRVIGGRGGVLGGAVFLCRFGLVGWFSVHVGDVHVVLCRFSGAVRSGAPG